MIMKEGQKIKMGKTVCEVWSILDNLVIVKAMEDEESSLTV